MGKRASLSDISNVKGPGNVVFQKDLEHKIEINYLMTEIKLITKEYEVTFDLFVTKFGSG